MSNITARQLAVLIKDYYKNNPSGGNCHIVLDDYNVRDSDIKFCMNECINNNDVDGLTIMIAMGRMKKTARLKSIYLKELIT